MQECAAEYVDVMAFDGTRVSVKAFWHPHALITPKQQLHQVPRRGAWGFHVMYSPYFLSVLNNLPKPPLRNR